jgi:hypothetical protein
VSVPAGRARAVPRHLVAVGSLLIVAGCSHLTLDAPSTPPLAATAAPTASATSRASAQAGRHADPALEALLPTSLGGVALTVESQAGPDLSRQSEALDAFLAGLGRTLADFTLASAYDAGGGLEAEVGAWRVRDAQSSALMPGFITAVQASSTTPLTVADTSSGGRTVTRIGGPGELTRGPIYAYVREDTILFVQTPHEDLAAAALEQLPEP